MQVIFDFVSANLPNIIITYFILYIFGNRIHESQVMRLASYYAGIGLVFNLFYMNPAVAIVLGAIEFVVVYLTLFGLSRSHDTVWRWLLIYIIGGIPLIFL